MAVNVVVVLAGLTVNANSAEVLAALLLSPAYSAEMLWAPAVLKV